MHRSLVFMGVLSWGFGCVGAPATRTATTASIVRPGIEVLLGDSLHLVQGRRVGLVTNQGGVDARGVHDVEQLRAAGVNLVALFSPEHGFRGTARPGEAVASTHDSATGLPIYSLYGRSSAPADSTLANLDVLLVDLPDVGARYYTYLSTTVEVMRSAARRHIPVLLLDRPNPIGGLMQGNVLDTAYRSFIGLLAVPMRHGLTLGEQARLARHDLGLTADLTVIPVSGWRRDQALDETGLPFIPPSPNLKSLESLFHYPGTCLFEGTNLTVGRGSDAPFEQIGAPWLDTTAVLRTVRDLSMAGVEFSGVAFTPRSPGDGKYADTLVQGIRLRVTDRERYDAPLTAITLLGVIMSHHPQQFRWLPAQFDRLAGGPGLREALSQGSEPRVLEAKWREAREAFRARSRPYLLY